MERLYATWENASKSKKKAEAWKRNGLLVRTPLHAFDKRLKEANYALELCQLERSGGNCVKLVWEDPYIGQEEPEDHELIIYLEPIDPTLTYEEFLHIVFWVGATIKHRPSPYQTALSRIKHLRGRPIEDISSPNI